MIWFAVGVAVGAAGLWSIGCYRYWEELGRRADEFEAAEWELLTASEKLIESLYDRFDIHDVPGDQFWRAIQDCRLAIARIREQRKGA
jgi:hypothetical protein